MSDSSLARFSENQALLEQLAGLVEADQTALLSSDSTVQQLKRELDALAGQLRQPVGDSSFEQEADCQRIIARVAGTATEASVVLTAPLGATCDDEFSRALVEHGLFEADELAALRRRLVPAGRVPGSQEFADLLVADGRLTSFQAQTVLAGKGKTLVIGSYTLLDKLGQGGMGVVYQALHRRMKRVVALKVLSPRLNSRPELVQRFQREVEAAARLSHPNIVRALDAEIAGARRFLVMEYIAGSDLTALVKQRGRMSVALAVECVLQAARGLDYAHRQGIVHRDVKPSNLLLTGDLPGKLSADNAVSTESGRDQKSGSGAKQPLTVKILDLGLARMTGDLAAAGLTSTGAVMGTIDYMAPEQAAATKHADARADIYSLGMTLWFLLTGRVAYAGDSPMARLLAHSEAPLPSLRAARGDVPRELEHAFRTMAAKKPDDRYSSMSAVVTILEGIQRGLSAELRAAPPFLGLQPGEDAIIEIGRDGVRVELDDDPFGNDHHTDRDARADSTIAYQAQFDADTAPTVIAGSLPAGAKMASTASDIPKSETPRSRRRLIAGLAVTVALAVGAIGLSLKNGSVTKPVDAPNSPGSSAASSHNTDAKKTPTDNEAVAAVNGNPTSTDGTAKPSTIEQPAPTREQLEQQLRDDPQNAELAGRLADALSRERLQQPGAGWSTVKLTAVRTEQGTTLSEQSDGSFLASAPVKNDIYEVEFAPDRAGITAIGIQALPDASLPQHGPGTHETGNFQLGEMSVESLAEDGVATAHSLSDVWASAWYPDAPPQRALDGRIETSWHVFGMAGVPHTAAFESKEPITRTGSQRLRVRLIHQRQEPPSNPDILLLGRFRLLITTEPRPVLSELLKDALFRQPNGWLSLAAEHWKRGQTDEARRTLERIPSQQAESDVRVRLLRSLVEYDAGQIDEARRLCAAAWQRVPQTQKPTLLEQLTASVTRLVFGMSRAGAQLALRMPVLNQLLENDPDNQGLINERLNQSLRLGQWKGAAHDALHFCEVADPARINSMTWMRIGYLALLGDDPVLYRRSVRELKARYGDSDSISDLERVCKSPLFMPGEFDIAEFPVSKFESLIHPEVPDTGSTYWACVTRAYIACHQGEPQAALDWLQHRIPVRTFGHVYTYWQLVEAQALHQLGRTEEAARSLATATEMIPPRLIQKLADPSSVEEPLTGEETHGDWLILELLRRQTQTQLSANPVKKGN